MKYTIKDNNIVVEAETARDNFALTKLMTDLPEKKESVEVKHRKHKRHMYLKTCDRCGGKFKGKIGLGIHQAKCSAGKREKLSERVSLIDGDSSGDSFFGQPEN